MNKKNMWKHHFRNSSMSTKEAREIYEEVFTFMGGVKGFLRRWDRATKFLENKHTYPDENKISSALSKDILNKTSNNVINIISSYRIPQIVYLKIRATK